jgi:hypothetical protein
LTVTLPIVILVAALIVLILAALSNGKPDDKE